MYDTMSVEAIRTPAKIAIRLIAQRGDEAEEIVHLSSISSNAKQVLLAALKNRRVQLYNLRGY